ncbi:hypothetical protein [Wielerella bovis]|nr:hypothetical protein [Wielerella bovis]ULJ63741.1 hypothetical protein MIS33_06060 [Wielerella bovis]ULJ66091.1 hypothetical protein MIS31_07375 [Wielerella bovis]
MSNTIQLHEAILQSIKKHDTNEFHQLISTPNGLTNHIAKLLENKETHPEMLEIFTTCLQHEQIEMIQLLFDEIQHLNQFTFQLDQNNVLYSKKKKSLEFLLSCQPILIDLIHQNKINYFMIFMKNFDEIWTNILSIQSNKYIQVERYYEKIAEFKGHILKAAVVNLNIEILQSLRILDEQNARQSSFLYTDKNGRTILHDLFDQWS